MPGIPIQVDLKNHTRLNQLKRGRDTFNDVISRLITGIADVYVEFILIDNELPQRHTVVFQLGEDAESWYCWDGEKLKKITVEETQKLMKQPKPNMTVTLEEALFIQYILMQPLTFPKEKPKFNQIDQNLERRIREFLKGESDVKVLARK